MGSCQDWTIWRELHYCLGYHGHLMSLGLQSDTVRSGRPFVVVFYTCIHSYEMLIYSFSIPKIPSRGLARLTRRSSMSSFTDYFLPQDPIYHHALASLDLLQNRHFYSEIR